ncbi:MAG: hypothetical protein KC733_11230, partial [Candidatus Omnitrophica bacterium]|nr:hypothetical protein [Candidatus Omnitrophota bacterium]
ILFTLFKGGQLSEKEYMRFKAVLLNGENIKATAHIEEALERIKYLANKFYKIDIGGVIHKGEVDYEEMQRFAVRLATFDDPIILKTFEELIQVKKDTVYPTELNNIAFNMAPQEFRNFIINMFNDNVIFNILSKELREELMLLNIDEIREFVQRIKGKVEASKTRLLQEKFEDASEMAGTFKFIKDIKVNKGGYNYPLFDISRIQYGFYHFANMQLPTNYRTWEGGKYTHLVGYRFLVEQTFGNDEYFELKRQLFDNLEKRRKLFYRMLIELKENGISEERLNELEGVFFRQGWVHLRLLKDNERAWVINAPEDKLSSQEVRFLQYDERIEKLIKDKMEFFIIRNNFKPNTPIAREYLTLPENMYLFDKVIATDGPAKVGGQTGLVVEFFMNLRGVIIAISSRYRQPLSFRLDGISEIRPEAALWLPILAAEVSLPNMASLSFPMYAADKKLSRVVANENIAGTTWTQVVQPWADKVGAISEYGKFISKESFEEIIVPPLSRAAEDAVAGINKLNLGADIRYHSDLMTGEGRGSTLKAARGPNEKYSLDYLELIQDYFASIFFNNPKVKANLKYTQFYLAGFYGWKPTVLINFITVFITIVILGIDLYAALPFAAFFILYYALASQAINRLNIVLLNFLHGFPFGFFEWVYRLIFYPGAIWHFTYYLGNYVIVQKLWSILGKSDFVPTVRTEANMNIAKEQNYQINRPVIRLGAGLIAFFITISPFTPSGLFFYEIFGVVIGVAMLIYPFLSNPRQQFDNTNTRFVSPIIGLILIVGAGLITGWPFLFALAGIHVGVYLFTLALARDRVEVNQAASLSEPITLFFLVAAALSYQQWAGFAILIWAVSNPNYREFLIKVIGHSIWAFFRANKENFKEYAGRILFWTAILSVIYIGNIFGKFIGGFLPGDVLVAVITSVLVIKVLFKLMQYRYYLRSLNKLENHFNNHPENHGRADQLAEELNFGYQWRWQREAFKKALMAVKIKQKVTWPLLFREVLLYREKVDQQGQVSQPQNPTLVKLMTASYAERYRKGMKGESIAQKIINKHKREFRKHIDMLVFEWGLAPEVGKVLKNVGIYTEKFDEILKN